MKDLTHLKPGDHIKSRVERSSFAGNHTPYQVHQIYMVDRVTPTLLMASPIGGFAQPIKVNRTNGRVHGVNYLYVTEATQADIEADRDQVEAVKQHRAANARLQDLIDQPFHRLKMTTVEMQVLAEAWELIKAARARAKEKT